MLKGLRTTGLFDKSCPKEQKNSPLFYHVLLFFAYYDKLSRWRVPLFFQKKLTGNIVGTTGPVTPNA